MTRRVEFPAESATSIARFAPLIFALKRFEELTRMSILRKIQTHRARYFCTHCAPVLFLPFEPKVSIFDNSTIERAILYILYKAMDEPHLRLPWFNKLYINVFIRFITFFHRLKNNTKSLRRDRNE